MKETLSPIDQVQKQRTDEARRAAELQVFTRTIACHLFADLIGDKFKEGRDPDYAFNAELAVIRAKQAAPFLGKALEKE